MNRMKRCNFPILIAHDFDNESHLDSDASEGLLRFEVMTICTKRHITTSDKLSTELFDVIAGHVVGFLRNAAEEYDSEVAELLRQLYSEFEAKRF